MGSALWAHSDISFIGWCHFPRSASLCQGLLRSCWAIGIGGRRKPFLDLRQLPIVGWPKLPFLHTVLKLLRVDTNNLQFLNVGPTLYSNNVDKVKQNQVSEIKFCHIYKYLLAKRDKISHKTCLLPVVNSLLCPYKWFGKYFMQYYHILLSNIPIFWWSCQLTGLARPQSFVN